MDVCVRLANQGDETKIAKLYKTVAGKSGGIARSENEITQRYISGNIKKSLDSGFCLVAEDKEDIIAEIHCYQPEAKVFQHVLSELTVVVHPDFQKQGMVSFSLVHYLVRLKNPGRIFSVWS